MCSDSNTNFRNKDLQETDDFTTTLRAEQTFSDKNIKTLVAYVS